MVDVQRLVFAQPYWPAFSSGAVDFIPLLDGCLHVRRRAARIPLLFFLIYIIVRVGKKPHALAIQCAN